MVEKVAAHVLAFENGIGRDFRERCERFYRQYRGFRKFRDAWVAAGPSDRDGVLYDAKKHWGAHLHIPLSFRTIETMVPRAIAHRPRMLYMPRREEFAQNVANVRVLIDAQQDNIDIDLPFQAVMRSGFIYGLGVGKCYWKRKWATRRQVERRMFLPGKFKVGQLRRELVFDDPMFEDVDVFDFMWDPYGSCMESAGWVVHRIWLSLEQVMERVKSGMWNTRSAQQLTEEDVRKLGGGQHYNDIWNERMAASGFPSFREAPAGEHVHEVWEWHDGEQVLTVLDRTVLVQQAESPAVGEIPFMVYRPTPLQKQMVGIGELEPLEHLQRELDTLRSQRRDAATIALCAGYAFDDAAVLEEDLVFGPAAAIRVTNARPSDAIMPLPTKEVPGSGYQEEQVIRQDFDAVAGMQDGLDNQPGGVASTATESMLVQAALSRRVEVKSRRFEIEVVRRAARCFLYLDQRMIVENRPPLRMPEEGYDLATAAREGRWQWFDIGPAELRGEFEVVPEGGSMAAENVPQMRQDAVQIMQLFGQNPYLDPRQPLMKALSLFGVKDPESWLKQAEPPVPPLALEALQRMGVDPRLIQRAIQVAQEQEPQLPPEQQGPGVGDVSQMMGMAA